MKKSADSEDTKNKSKKKLVFTSLHQMSKQYEENLRTKEVELKTALDEISLLKEQLKSQLVELGIFPQKNLNLPKYYPEFFKMARDETVANMFFHNLVNRNMNELHENLQRYSFLILTVYTFRDLNGTLFSDMTALQYAILTLDKPLWRLLLKFLSPENAAEQLMHFLDRRIDLICKYNTDSYDNLLRGLAYYYTTSQKPYKYEHEHEKISEYEEKLRDIWRHHVYPHYKLLPYCTLHFIAEQKANDAWDIDLIDRDPYISNTHLHDIKDEYSRQEPPDIEKPGVLPQDMAILDQRTELTKFTKGFKALLRRMDRELVHLLTDLKLDASQWPCTDTIIRDYETAIVHSDLKIMEEVLESRKEFIHREGTIVDLSDRKFPNITGFQYAIWSRNLPLCRLMLKYLTTEQAIAQLEKFRRNIEAVHQFGLTFNFEAIFNRFKSLHKDFENKQKNIEYFELEREVTLMLLQFPGWVMRTILYIEESRSLWDDESFGNAVKGDIDTLEQNVILLKWTVNILDFHQVIDLQRDLKILMDNCERIFLKDQEEFNTLLYSLGYQEALSHTTHLSYK